MSDICTTVIDFCGFWGTLLIVATLLLFGVQLYFYLSRYGRLAKYRNRDREDIRGDEEGISVVVLVSDNRWYLENMLPKLLHQDYPEFEVVVVDIGSAEEFSNDLYAMKERYPNLVSTKIIPDPRFSLINKIAYNVGIKATSYENIILTTADAVPTSDRWLRCMGKGFASGDVLVGYSGIEQRKGVLNKFFRSSRFMLSVRYLSSAIAEKPYRGVIHNLGFRRELYFESRGFGFLDMNLGEDDLFIQKIATPENTSVVMNPNATVRQGQWGGIGWWWNQQRFYHTTSRYYPTWAKTTHEWEMVSRSLFFFSTIILIIAMPLEIKLGAIGLLLIRSILVRYKMWQIRRRLKEPKLGVALMFYDLIEPITKFVIFVANRIRKPSGV